MSIYRKLKEIQGAVKAPKSQYNSFGKYSYRSAEDILEALKPLLQEKECVLMLNDEIIEMGNRFYVQATAILFDVEEGKSIFTRALAREEEVKKGMDGSQVTGAASSYARKYALNGLFCLDDQKDSDTTNQGKPNDSKGKPDEKNNGNGKTGKRKAQEALFATIRDAKFSEQSVKAWMESEYGVTSTNDMDVGQLKKFRSFILEKRKEVEEISKGGEEI